MYVYWLGEHQKKIDGFTVVGLGETWKTLKKSQKYFRGKKGWIDICPWKQKKKERKKNIEVVG